MNRKPLGQIFPKNGAWVSLLATLFLVAGSFPRVSAAEVFKPAGLFSSTPAGLPHPEMRGALIRALWKDIEASPGIFSFNGLRNQRNNVADAGKKWSLAISAGSNAPAWLIDQMDAPFLTYTFRDAPVRIPLWWNPIVRERLALLSQELGRQFADDEALVLIYVPQMTANGIEGHFNGAAANILTDAGYTEDAWVAAAEETAREIAAAFPHKAVAFEVHNILNSSEPARRILHDLWEDPTLDHRVGAGLWWLSGRTDYQANLLAVLDTYPGDIYCQAIQKSTTVSSFLNNNYTSIFAQAKALSARYIELWEYEFVHDTFPEAFRDFNAWADDLAPPSAHTSHWCLY